MATGKLNFALALYGDDDPRATATQAPIGTIYQRSTTGELFTKTGQGDTAWKIVAASTSSRQVFAKVCDGTEGESFTIVLPSERASANYQVQITMASPPANAMKMAQGRADSKTTVDFDVELSAPAENGDVLWLTVEDVT